MRQCVGRQVGRMGDNGAKVEVAEVAEGVKKERNAPEAVKRMKREDLKEEDCTVKKEEPVFE